MIDYAQVTFKHAKKQSLMLILTVIDAAMSLQFRTSTSQDLENP